MSRFTTDAHVMIPALTAGAVASSPHVLIADSDETTREQRHAQLSRAGLRVSVARTGFEAIIKASCQVPDVILLDESLSDIDASETGRLLTTCPVTSHIPVVHLMRGRRLPRRMVAQLSRVAV